MTSKQAKSKTKKEECVSCGIETPYDENDHVDLRSFYIQGCGQLCCDCFNEIYDFKKNERIQQAKKRSA